MNKIPLNSKMSWQAKGMLAYLLSKPDDWTTNAEHLSTVSCNGRESCLSILSELRQEGYAHLIEERDKGKIIGKGWVITENPGLTSGLTENYVIIPGRPKKAKSKSVLPKSGFPTQVLPTLVLPTSAKPTLLSNEVLSNDKLSNNNIINNDNIIEEVSTTEPITSDLSPLVSIMEEYTTQQGIVSERTASVEMGAKKKYASTSPEQAKEQAILVLDDLCPEIDRTEYGVMIDSYVGFLLTKGKVATTNPKWLAENSLKMYNTRKQKNNNTTQTQPILPKESNTIDLPTAKGQVIDFEINLEHTHQKRLSNEAKRIMIDYIVDGKTSMKRIYLLCDGNGTPNEFEEKILDEISLCFK